MTFTASKDMHTYMKCFEEGLYETLDALVYLQAAITIDAARSNSISQMAAARKALSQANNAVNVIDILRKSVCESLKQYEEAKNEIGARKE